MHKLFKSKHAVDTVIILFVEYPHYQYYFFVIEHSVFMVLVFNCKSMLEKVTIQRTQLVLDFSCYQKNSVNPTQCIRSNQSINQSINHWLKNLHANYKENLMTRFSSNIENQF